MYFDKGTSFVVGLTQYPSNGVYWGKLKMRWRHVHVCRMKVRDIIYTESLRTTSQLGREQFNKKSSFIVCTSIMYCYNWDGAHF